MNFSRQVKTSTGKLTISGSDVIINKAKEEVEKYIPFKAFVKVPEPHEYVSFQQIYTGY